MSLNLFYTGADTLNAVQRDVAKSLGGFKSSSPLFNAASNNLFSDISYQEVQSASSGNEEINLKALVLMNEGDLVENLYFHFEIVGGNDNSFCEYEFTFLTLVNGKMERIYSRRSFPSQIGNGWVSPLGEVNKVLVSNSLAANATIGFWIKRKVKEEIEALALTCENSFADISQNEFINFVFSFD